MDQQSPTEALQAALTRNMALRLELLQLESDLRLYQARIDCLQTVNDSLQAEAIGWQQAAMAAIAKADAIERTQKRQPAS